MRSFAVDEARHNVTAFGIFRGTHTGEGGPVPPTGKSAEADYVYVMEFDGRQDPPHDQDLERRHHHAPARLGARLRLDDDVDQPARHHDHLLRRGAVEERGTFSSASAAASSASASASAATVMRPRTLPLTCTGYSTVSSTRYCGSATGNGPCASDVSWPSRLHSSSARCGASGATISTSGSSAARAVTPCLVRWLVYSMSLAAAVLLRSVA